jgi:phosphoglycolate phosphatase
MGGQSHGKLAKSIIAAKSRGMSPIPFDVVAFDLDGTLADTSPDLAAALNHMLGALGRPPVASGSVRNFIGHGARALVRRGLADTGDAPEDLVDRAFPIFIDHYRAHIADGTSIYPGLEEALHSLAAVGVRLAVCTNKIESLTLQLLDSLGWAGRFDAVVAGDTLPVRKPDPAPLQEAIRRAGGGRAIFVGDSITDAETALAAGLPIIAVSFGFSDRPVAQLGATVVIDSYSELLDALRGL